MIVETERYMHFFDTAGGPKHDSSKWQQKELALTVRSSMTQTPRESFAPPSLAE